MSISLFSLNVEGNRHWERILPYIDEHIPEVCCFQEIFEKDLELLASRGYTHTFLPMTLHFYDDKDEPSGIAICSKLPIKETQEFYYYKTEGTTHRFERDHKRDTIDHCVLVTTIQKIQQYYMHES